MKRVICLSSKWTKSVMTQQVKRTGFLFLRKKIVMKMIEIEMEGPKEGEVCIVLDEKFGYYFLDGYPNMAYNSNSFVNFEEDSVSDQEKKSSVWN